MAGWKEFYAQIRDPSWPDCAEERDFFSLPVRIQNECREIFGYRPGQFAKADPLPHRPFPIKTATACQLKWTWSTVYLTTEKTASCHRTNHHKFDAEKFDFHNTPNKLRDRQKMLQGEWPDAGCEYCRNIEQAGGISDRLTNLDLIGVHAPIELDHDPTAIEVTPRILEIYFDNTCDLKCLYCGPHFSSAWEAESNKYGTFGKDGLIIESTWTKSNNIDRNKTKLFSWLSGNIDKLSALNVLGGEPTYQDELDQVLDLLDQHPAPHLKLQMFSNLNSKPGRLRSIVERVNGLINDDKLRELEITGSLDCWGPAQEYVRYPLNLDRWQENFEYLLDQSWVRLIVSSTVTPLTVKTLPDLLAKIKKWNETRTVYHYQNSVNAPSHMFIDIFGDIFREDFNRALDLKLTRTPEEISSKRYLEGIAKQSYSRVPNVKEIKNLYLFLEEMDRRRKTDWRQTFTWLEDEFKKHEIIGEKS